MDASPVKLINYFSQKNQYIIPLFQRPYVWKKENWDTLWNDILSYYEDEESLANSCPHFMGAIVSIQAKTVPVGIDKYLIIDGQQRLTTFSILLCALRDSTEKEEISGEIQDLLTNKYKKDENFLKLLPTQTDRQIYIKLIKKEFDNLNVTEREHKIYKCYQYFQKCLKSKTEEEELIEPDRIYKILSTRFLAVMINLTDTDDPYLIFESLNFKGEKLTQADLIRNLLLMKFRHTSGDGGEQEEIYEAYWLPWEKCLGDKLEDFFFHYIRMEKAVKSNKSKIYSDLKSYLQSYEDIRDCLNNIHRYVQYYDILLHPEKEENKEIRKELEFLNRTDCTVVYPFLLKLGMLTKKDLANEKYLKCLRIINSLIIRKIICQRQTNSLNGIIVNLLSRLKEPKDYSNLDIWLEEELKNQSQSARWPEDSEFKNAIQSKKDISSSMQILFLEEIEKFLAGKEMVNLDGITLEHIMPQTLTDDWRKALGKESEVIHNEYLGNLGNLTLTGYNSEYSNKPFETKKNMSNGYAQSGLKINQEIAQNDHWGKEEILQRVERLADYAVQIWKHPGRTSCKFLTLSDVWTFTKPMFIYIKNQKISNNYMEKSRTLCSGIFI